MQNSTVYGTSIIFHIPSYNYQLHVQYVILHGPDVPCSLMIDDRWSMIDDPDVLYYSGHAHWQRDFSDILIYTYKYIQKSQKCTTRRACWKVFFAQNLFNCHTHAIVRKWYSRHTLYAYGNVLWVCQNEHAQNRKNEQIDDGDETLMYDKLAVTGNGGKASIVSASSNDGFEAE